MGFRERLQREITITVLQRQCIIIVTMLSTLCAINAWPRFLNDATSIEWYFYLIPILIFALPLVFRKN